MKLFDLDLIELELTCEGLEISLGNNNGTLIITQEFDYSDVPCVPFQDSSRDPVETEYDFTHVDLKDHIQGRTLLEAIEQSKNISWQKA